MTELKQLKTTRTHNRLIDSRSFDHRSSDSIDIKNDLILALFIHLVTTDYFQEAVIRFINKTQGLLAQNRGGVEQ